MTWRGRAEVIKAPCFCNSLQNSMSAFPVASWACLHVRSPDALNSSCQSLHCIPFPMFVSPQRSLLGTPWVPVRSRLEISVCFLFLIFPPSHLLQQTRSCVRELVAPRRLSQAHVPFPFIQRPLPSRRHSDTINGGQKLRKTLSERLVFFAAICHLCHPTPTPIPLGRLDPIPMWEDSHPNPSPPNNSQTPAACLRIQLSSDTFYREIASDPARPVRLSPGPRLHGPVSHTDQTGSPHDSLLRFY